MSEQGKKGNTLESSQRYIDTRRIVDMGEEPGCGLAQPSPGYRRPTRVTSTPEGSMAGCSSPAITHFTLESLIAK